MLLIKFSSQKILFIKKNIYFPVVNNLNMHPNKRKLNLLVFLAACVFISIAATKPSATKTIVKSATAKDTGIFKNLKVLPKTISKDSLDMIMDHFKVALGVKCNFCHAFNNGKMDFASDEKDEKNIARYMINMTAGINKTYFNAENSTRPDTISIVRCITCHHGNAHPDESNMMEDNNGNMPPPPPPHDSSGKMSPPPNQ